MKFRTKYKIGLHKSYLDCGIGNTAYIKYAIAVFGMYSVGENIPMNLTVYAGMLYMIFCYIFGRAFYKHGWIEAFAEVANQYNKFQREVRRKLNNRKI